MLRLQRLFGLSCLLLMLLVSCATGGRQRAEEALSRGAYYEAEQGYRSLYRSAPKKERLQRARFARGAGEAALRGRRIASARQLLETAQRLQPSDSLTKSLLAELTSRWGTGGEEPKDTVPSPYEVRPFAPLRSARSDYGVAFRADGRELFFTTHRGRATGKHRPSPVTGELPAQIYRLTQRPDGAWSPAPDSLAGLSALGKEVGTPTFTPDGRTLFFTSILRTASGRELAQIFRAERSAQGRWEVAERVPLFADSLVLTAHPTLSPSGEKLFFVSDVAGGRGGKDLYLAERTGQGWGVPQPLGVGVNSSADELFPFAVSDSLLYFASDRAGGFGGLDLYRARLQPTGDYHVEHLPRPLNSSADDYGFYPSPVPQAWSPAGDLVLAGLLASAREDLAGRPHLYEVLQRAVTTTITVEVLDREGFPIPRSLVRLVGKTSTGGEQALSTDAEGRASFAVEPGIDYVMLASAPDYLNQFVRLHTDVEPAGETYSVTFYLASRVRAEQLREVYYAFDSADLLPASEEALGKLLKLLEDNPEVRLELSAHADRWGSAGYNQRLALRRAEAVARYLTAHGIAPERLTSRGYGKERPFVVTRGVASAYPFLTEGQTLSEDFVRSLPTDAEREVCDQLNRRTEFRVVE